MSDMDGMDAFNALLGELKDALRDIGKETQKVEDLRDQVRTLTRDLESKNNALKVYDRDGGRFERFLESNPKLMDAYRAFTAQDAIPKPPVQTPDADIPF